MTLQKHKLLRAVTIKVTRWTHEKFYKFTLYLLAPTPGPLFGPLGGP